MSENVSMGPHCNDSGFICQKTPEWGPFSFALNRNHNERIKKAQVKALRSRPWRPRIKILLLIPRAMRPPSGILRQEVPKSLHCMRAHRAAQASARRASCV